MNLSAHGDQFQAGVHTTGDGTCRGGTTNSGDLSGLSTCCNRVKVCGLPGAAGILLAGLGYLHPADTAERDLLMTDETLRQLLSRVHERLSSSSTIDLETREMLATVMRDIEGTLGTATSAASARPGSVPSVASTPVSADARVAAAQPRLEALAVRFEAQHPAMAQLLRQIGELLAQAGI